MKFVLVLFLLSTISCNNVWNCLVTNPSALALGLNFLKPLKEQDYGSVISLALDNISEIKSVVLGCLGSDTSDTGNTGNTGNNGNSSNSGESSIQDNST